MMGNQKKMQELEMKVWFLENELYLDGSNVCNWLQKLKKQLENLFEINLSKEVEKWKKKLN